MQESVLCPGCGARFEQIRERVVHCPSCSAEVSVSMNLVDPGEANTLSEAPEVSPDASDSTLSFDRNAAENVATSDALGKGVRPDVSHFGDYELITKIAQGGMGVVYKARHVKLNRLVALKMIRSGEFASRQEVQRFFSEASAAAGLEHPGIVPIYEFGEQDGQQFFTMAYVEGESLAARVAGGPLPARDAAGLVRQIAAAIDYAHRQGVLHRDLKPANILLDREGQPKVADFGLAKQLQSDSELTATGQILGTPSYMPPEQAQGALEEISPAADVYSLGAILYCLLCGKPPFQAATVAEVIRQVVEAEPVPLRQLNPGIPRDLETIAMKCLEKDRNKRYASAAELAEELDRFLTGLPIVARPVSSLERVHRFACRQPVIASLLATVAVSLLAGSIISTYFWREASIRFDEAQANALNATRAEEKAKAAETEERAQRIKAEQQTRLANEREQEAVRRRQEAERQTRKSVALRLASEARNERSADPILATLLGIEAVEATRPDGLTLPVAEQALREALAAIRFHTLTGHDGKIAAASISPNDRWLAVASDDKNIRLWDLSQVPERLSCQLVHKHAGGVKDLEFAPNGRWLVVQGLGGGLSLYPLAETQRLKPSAISLARLHEKTNFDFTAGGDWLVTHESDEGIVRFWNLTGSVTEHAPLELQSKLPIYRTALSPDGSRLITIHTSKALASELDTSWKPGREPQGVESGGDDLAGVLARQGNKWREVEWSNLSIWDLTELPPQRMRTLPAVHADKYVGVAVSPNGQWLLTCGRKGLWEPSEVVRYWDLTDANPQPINLLEGIESLATNKGRIPVSSNGRWAALSGLDNVFLVEIQPTDGPRVIALNPTKSVVYATFSPDDSKLIGKTEDGAFVVWDLTQRHPAIAPKYVASGPDTLWSWHFTSDARQMVTTGRTRVRHWALPFAPVASPRVLRVEEATEASQLQLSPNGRYLARRDHLGAQPRLILWDLSERAPRAKTLLLEKFSCDVFQFSPDSAGLAFSGVRQLKAAGVEYWQMSTRKKTFFATRNLVTALAFSRPQRWLAAGSQDGKVLVRDLQWPSTAAWQSLKPHEKTVGLGTAAVRHLAFAKGGTRLVSIAHNGVCHIYDREPGGHFSKARVIGSIERAFVTSGLVSPDGRWLYRQLTVRPENSPATAEKVTRRNELFDLSASGICAYPLPPTNQYHTADFHPTSKLFALRGKYVWVFSLLRQENPVEKPFGFTNRWSSGYERIRFLPGNRIVTIQPRGGAYIWDLQRTGPPVEVSKPSTASFWQHGVVCSHRRFAAIPVSNGEIHVHPLWVDDLLKLARETVGRPLTKPERRMYSIPED